MTMPVLQDIARFRARGDSPEAIALATGYSEATIAALCSSDAYRALEREEVIRLRGGDA